MTSLNSCLADAPYPVVGLTGGIAAGKTYAAIRLAASEWVVINADQVAREVVEPGTEGLAELVAAFGAGILGPDGALDRAGLAALVFAEPAQRVRLEALLHPRIEAGLAAAPGRPAQGDQGRGAGRRALGGARPGPHLRRALGGGRAGGDPAQAPDEARRPGPRGGHGAHPRPVRRGREGPARRPGVPERRPGPGRAAAQGGGGPAGPLEGRPRPQVAAAHGRAVQPGPAARRCWPPSWPGAATTPRCSWSTAGPAPWAWTTDAWRTSWRRRPSASACGWWTGETTRFADLIAPTVEELLEAARNPGRARLGRRRRAAPAGRRSSCPSPAPSTGSRAWCRSPRRWTWCAGPTTWPATRAETQQAGAAPAGGRGLRRQHPERLDRRRRARGRGLERHPHRGPAHPERAPAQRHRGRRGQPADRLPVPGRDPGLRAVHVGSGGAHRARGGAPGLPGPHRAARPGRHLPGDPQQQRRRHHDPRGLRARAGGRPGPGRGERLRRQAGPAGGGAKGSPSSTTAPCRTSAGPPPATTRATRPSGWC